jgi:CheY-like chemotaxis protein
MMPGMDGFEVIEHIQRNAAFVRPTILMLSSADRVEDAGRCRAIGVVYLTKPVKQSELLDAILDSLSRSGGVATSTIRPVAQTAETVAEQESSLPPLRILLAEDNEVNQMVAVKLLQKRGHEVVVVGTGREAVTAIESQTFDVVLMDVQMPEMDGLAATAAIRVAEQNTNRHVPIVALTAHAMKGDRERFLDAGMDDYVSKPIQAKELWKTLVRVIAMPPAEATLPGGAMDTAPTTRV